MNPARRRAVAVLPNSLPAAREIETISWTPCGGLLTARCLPSGPTSDIHLIFDPDSLALIYKLEVPAFRKLSWRPRIGSPGTVPVHQPWSSCVVTFQHGSSGWQATERHLPQVAVSHDAAFSLCGKLLMLKVGTGKDAPHRLHCYGLHDTVCKHIASYPECQFWPATGWVPLPRGWRPLLAYHVHIASLIHLVDVASPKMVGCWTKPELLKMAGSNAIGNSYDNWMVPAHMLWACSGKHLSVSYTTCTIVMTFCQDVCK